MYNENKVRERGVYLRCAHRQKNIARCRIKRTTRYEKLPFILYKDKGGNAMTTKELENFISEKNKNRPFVSKRAVMRTLGISYKKATKLLSDITPLYGTNHHKRSAMYFVDDVAKEVMRKGL